MVPRRSWRYPPKLTGNETVDKSFVGWGAGGDGLERKPNKPVKVIAPSAPGDGLHSRACHRPKLTERWGKSVLVEKPSGRRRRGRYRGRGALCADEHGHQGQRGLRYAISIRRCTQNYGYDVVRDCADRHAWRTAPNVFTVNQFVPAKTVAEFIALAKKEPGKYSFASGGGPALRHTSMRMFVQVLPST